MRKTIGKIVKKQSLFIGICTAIMAEICITLMGCLLIGKFIESGSISEENIERMIYTIPLLAALIGGMTAEAKTACKSGLASVITGVIYWGLLLCINAIVFQAGYTSIPVMIIIIMTGSVIAAVLETGFKKSKQHKEYKIFK